MKHIFIHLIQFVAVLFFAVMTSSRQPVCAADTDIIPEHIMFSYAKAPVTYPSPIWWCDSYMGGAILLTEDIVRRFDKCTITEVEIANGIFFDIEEAPVTIFFTHDLYAQPFYSFTGFMDIDNPKEYKAYKLHEPLQISANEPFYVGFTGYAPYNDFARLSHPILTDGALHTNLTGGYIGSSYTTGVPEEMEWNDEGYSGGQVCIRLKIEGDNLPQNTVELKEIIVPDYMVPDSTYWAAMEICNKGANMISDVDVTYTIFDDTISTHFKFNEPMKYDQSTWLNFWISVHEEGVNKPVSFAIDKVNGQVPSPTSTTVMESTIHSLCHDSGFFHNMVVEELGGSGCGWCVRGIVGFDRTFKAHGDGSFIPISAQHPGYNKETAPFGYEPLWDKYITHVPTCLINRNLPRYGISTPSSEHLLWCYNDIIAIPAIAEIKIDGYTVEREWLSVDSKVRFAFPEDDGKYSVAYVVTEDNVGPYFQNNSFAGTEEDMDGWENLPSQTITYYDFLARGISNFYGTPLSLPTKIEPGVAYSHSDSVNLIKVTDRNNLTLVAMVINDKTGCIENGYRLKVGDINSMNGIAVDSGMHPVEYYDLSGRRLSGKPSSGFYIRRQGSHAEKILIP